MFTNLIFINLGEVVEDPEVLRQVFGLWTYTMLNLHAEKKIKYISRHVTC